MEAMADEPKGPKSVPAHLLPLFRGKVSERTLESLEKALGAQTERISTSRVGRAVKLTAFAAKTGKTAFVGKMREAIVGPGSKAKAVEEAWSAEVAAEMLQTFAELRGVTMKLGQMLSYLDDALPPEARKILALLQRDAPPMPWATVEAQLARELGRPVAELFRSIETTPLAAASIGQVHRAVLLDGTQVAVKVQYPGIEEAMGADLKNAKVLSMFRGMFLFRTDMPAIMRELEERFLDECDYTKEADYQETYRARFAGHPWIVVPEVHRALTTKRVLVTTLHHGASFYEWLEGEPPPEVRERMAKTFYRFYIGSFYLDGLFNCDPHPGNYLFQQDGRVVFLDYGCSRRFSPQRLEKWIELCRAVYEDDAARLERLAVELDFFGPGVDYDRESFRQLMRYLYLPYLTDGPFHFSQHRPEDTFRRMFVDNPNLFKLNMPADAVFLNRIGFGLVSLLTQIGAPLDCRHQASSYFEGIDPEWPEDPLRGHTPVLALARARR
jgi:predicted unusual protein kinase regulating ubiquinone biosynthesis (AarF/ABC1/UbiB family)